ncbi:uncharacterized protein LOC129236994 [Anastrepha obliqua]|uniref:uncharacterized protein LOC129236994 n=1 Tax=Anastrepha obliqua TaxID=95512 RepID=UPI002409F45B|nr:uncharacterized protein LOC129236994 [Anastrepha obliqua]
MTSFGADKIVRDNYMPTFKIQGQIYHRVGSLLPLPEQNHKFLQIYFVGNTETEIDLRCAISHNIRRGIIIQLQEFFHEHNELVHFFRTSLERMMSDSHKIVIRPNKTPVLMHARRYNAPSVDEVAIVIVGDNFEKT